MSHRRPRRSSKAGLSPGTLVHVGDRRVETTALEVIDYDADNLREVPTESLAGCLERRDTRTVSWINVDGLHDLQLVEKLGAGFGIHALALEDVLNTESRPKLEDYEGHLFVVAKMLSWDEKQCVVASEQVSFVLGLRWLVTFQERGGDVFDPVRARLRAGRGRMRKLGADYLMYALLDAIVDNYFLILERLDDRIEALELELVDSPGQATVREIHRLKREMIDLRRAVWPLREVLGGLGRIESPLVAPETHIFLRDVHDHTVQIADTIEGFRDLLAGMLDIYMSTLNNRMNAIMKVLTMIATIFIPLTFIVGIYGMNFDHMAELHWRWGYPLVLAVMAAIAAGMLAIFRRRGWF
jgi:magnesium transporter